jgi:hypothetical protein
MYSLGLFNKCTKRTGARSLLSPHTIHGHVSKQFVLYILCIAHLNSSPPCLSYQRSRLTHLYRATKVRERQQVSLKPRAHSNIIHIKLVKHSGYGSDISGYPKLTIPVEICCVRYSTCGPMSISNILAVGGHVFRLNAQGIAFYCISDRFVQNGIDLSYRNVPKTMRIKLSCFSTFISLFTDCVIL